MLILNSWSRNRQIPAGNPIANAIVVVVGVLAIALSLVVGFFAFIALACLFLVVGAVVGIRLWWAQRRMNRRHRKDGDRRPDGIIEGEYRVISREYRRDRR